MASLALGVVGAVIGGIWGGAPGAQAGFMIGSALGSALFPPEGPTVEGQRINDLMVQQSSYGAIIPRIYGKYRLSGNIIWATDIVEHRHEEEVGGKGGGGGETQITYTYTTSFAVSLCEGEIAAVTRMWADGKLIYDARDTSGSPMVNFETTSYKFYTGSEDQMPDPTMEAALGVGNVPGYRGQAIAVFADLQLKPYANRIPNLTFEVVRSGTNSLELMNTAFVTDPTHGGELLIYNPILNELWNFIPSSFDQPFSGVCRRNVNTFAEIGDIDSTGASGAASIQSGIFGHPQFDRVRDRIYVMGYSPNKILKFDATNATFLGRIDWPSSFQPAYWAVDPTDGSIWGVTNTGTPTLQQIDPMTNTVLTNVTSPGGGLDMVVDNNGLVWQFGGNDLYKYDGGFTVALHDDDGIADAVYDPDTNSIWYITFSDDFYTKWRGYSTITNISATNPVVVTHTGHFGQPFVTGQSVMLKDITGMDELFPTGSYGAFHFTITVIDSTHFSIPVNGVGYTPYASGGMARSNKRRLKRYSIAFDTVDLTLDVDSYGFGETKNLMFDQYRHVIWTFMNEGATLTAVNLTSGAPQWRASFTPSNYPWWVSPSPNALWVNDSTYEMVNRITIANVLNESVWTVGMVVADISYKCGMTGDDINVEALTMPITGYGLTVNLAGRGAIEPLMKAYMFDSVDSDGKVKYVVRGGRPAALIKTDEMVNQP